MAFFRTSAKQASSGAVWFESDIVMAESATAMVLATGRNLKEVEIEYTLPEAVKLNFAFAMPYIKSTSRQKSWGIGTPAAGTHYIHAYVDDNLAEGDVGRIACHYGRHDKSGYAATSNGGYNVAASLYPDGALYLEGASGATIPAGTTAHVKYRYEV